LQKGEIGYELKARTSEANIWQGIDYQ